jgi:hypothetical protein
MLSPFVPRTALSCFFLLDVVISSVPVQLILLLQCCSVALSLSFYKDAVFFTPREFWDNLFPNCLPHLSNYKQMTNGVERNRLKIAKLRMAYKKIYKKQGPLN